MPTILNINTSRAVDINSYAVPGALATFHNSGTTALRTVYTDPDCTIPHPSPVVADGAGVFPPIYDVGGTDAKVTVTTPEGVVLAGYPIDPVSRATTDVTGASSVSFDPTSDIPETNVQDAIEHVQANIVEPLAEFGLGVTGNATVIPDIDAVGTASGIYRYNGSTGGTFPSGETSSSGGTVRIWRENASNAIMILTPRYGTRQHARRLAAGSWGDWTYQMRSNDMTADNSNWESGTGNQPYVVSPANISAAIAAQTIGIDQSWSNPSRDIGTVYSNGTGRPIMVNVSTTGDATFMVNPGSGWVTIASDVTINSDGRLFLSVIIPTGHDYRITSGLGASIEYWSELR